ncbi:MAG: L-histidine Nalpha-methyltransferase [Pseudonocardiales bacterium]|jgi:L-histidine N-alpha-methyltransferase|nr:L-histidine Nalpha-methyltransferase [Pseudonocardiales bacterium]
MASDLRVQLAPEAYLESLRRDVRAGLTASPKTLPPKYFYDARGSDLFDEITRLPEYYPTRAETAILTRHAGEVAALSGARTLVELGSGTSAKTRLLLTALTAAGTLERFVPFDVDPAVLAHAAEQVGAEYPGLAVEPVIGDFEKHLAALPRHPAQLIAFLGSTIGNLEPADRARLFGSLRAVLRPGDSFLLGTDLVKDPARLQRAYDDPAGVTAAFNRNVLSVVNRELSADFEESWFEHVALWNADREWIEMHLLSLRDQLVTVGDLDLQVPFARGELMRTEISAKFRPDGIRAELDAAGFELVRFWTDPAGDFGLSLARPR